MTRSLLTTLAADGVASREISAASPCPGQPPWQAIWPAPCFCLGIRHDGQGVTELVFLPPDTPVCRPRPADALGQQVWQALEAWLADPAYAFSLPTSPRGTPFQQRTWAAISAIPCGQTRRYGELATDLQSSPRAVGQACGRNPLPLIVPCHRVVARHGPGGFALTPAQTDHYLSRSKAWLLSREQAVVAVPPPPSSR